MKRFAKVIAAGVALGLTLVAIQRVFQIEDRAFMRGYWVGGATVVVAAALFNLLYTRHYMGKMREAAALLEEGRADEYISTVEGLIRAAKGRTLKNILRLNLTAGYCDKKDFAKAIQILEQLEDQPLRGQVKMIQRLNLCLCYFFVKQDDRAAAVYDASGELFIPYRGGEIYGKNIAVADMLADIQKGWYDEARERLATARKRWKGARIEADYDFIEELLEGKDDAR